MTIIGIAQTRTMVGNTRRDRTMTMMTIRASQRRRAASTGDRISRRARLPSAGQGAGPCFGAGILCARRCRTRYIVSGCVVA